MLNEKKIGKGGQLTIPVHIRRELGLQDGEKVALMMQDGNILLERITGSCILCGGHEDLINMGGKYLCRQCIQKAADKAEQEVKNDE